MIVIEISLRCGRQRTETESPPSRLRPTTYGLVCPLPSFSVACPSLQDSSEPVYLWAVPGKPQDIGKSKDGGVLSSCFDVVKGPIPEL